jgi:two-component system, LytTR family, response regulator
MRVLIVDDERPARERLRRLLAAFDDVQLVGEAQDGEDALRQVAALAPDALFLDVQMPGASGLDVAASLPEPAPAVVFVTAFDHYALQAFDSAAVDYLLKPVAPDRLARAVQRLLQRFPQSSRERLPQRSRERGVPPRETTRPPPAQLLIPDRGRTHVVRVADILWLEAADNYVVVHTPERAPLIRRTLAGLLADLGGGFMRTQRGAAVALAKVQQVQTRSKGDAVLVLRGGADVPCSRRYRAALLDALSARLDGAG